MKPICTATSFSDKNVANGYYPNGATNVEVGHLATVLSGLDYGDVVPIASVSKDSSGNSTIFNLSNNWAIQPLPNDIIVIVDPSSRPNWASPKITILNQLAGPSTVSEPQIENLAYQQYLLTVRACSPNGNYVPDQYAPMRDVYISGSQGTRTITGPETMAITDGIILADATWNNITFTLLPFSTIPNQTIKVQRVDSSTTNTVTINTTLGPLGAQVDYINGQPSVALTSQWSASQITIGGK
jgi:hypothetical protein